MAHAFISYVRENSDQIDRLALDLYKRGIDTWTDRDIRPGSGWQNTIRKAIESGASFLACFSPEAVSKTDSYMNDELAVAVETLRRLSYDGNWLLPVMLSRCEIPDLHIDAARSLRDLQWVEMFPSWEAGVSKIASGLSEALRYEKHWSDTSEPRLPPLRSEPSLETITAWHSVWRALFALQVSGEALFNRIDRVRLTDYATRLHGAIDTVSDAAFFFDKDDFDELNALLRGALMFRDGKEDVMNCIKHPEIPVGIARRIGENLATFETFCWVLSDIRARYSLRPTKSPWHLAAQRNARYDAKIKSLEARVARSERRAQIRTAVASMVQRGEIGTNTECPHGHGRLKEWESLPRCWSCGWPWTELERGSAAGEMRSTITNAPKHSSAARRRD